MSDKLKKSLVIQGSILAIAGLVSKIIGFLYRIPMANIMGNTGNGIYSVSFGIYNIALTLSSYSMPLAVSKLMSARLAKKEYKNAHRLFRDALIFAIIAGTIACLVLFFGAEFLAKMYCKEGLERPLRILAPTTFVVAILGTCRGYYQGHRNMVPTAISQVIEQIVNAIVSVVAASSFVRAALSEQPDLSASYGAMGGTLGTFAGAGIALVMFLILFFLQRKNRQEEMLQDDLASEDHKLLYKALFLTIIPVILSQSIYQLGYTLDDFMFGNLMTLKGLEENVVTDLQGIFNTQYNQMINLPAAIATAMASASIPSIVASFTRKEMEGVKQKIDVVLKINMLIAIPSAIGLAVLADPIMSVLFPGLEAYHSTAVRLLQTGSSAVIFYTLSTMTTSVLQGCDRMRIPVIHSGISLAIHVAVVAVLVYYTDLSVYALIIGNVTFPLIVCLLNCRSVSKLLGYRFDWNNILMKPMLAALIMGAAAYGTYILVLILVKSKLIAMIGSILVALVIYLVLLYLWKVLTKEVLSRFPLVGKRFR